VKYSNSVSMYYSIFRIREKEIRNSTLDMEVKSVETESVETKSAEVESVETKSVKAKSVETKSVKIKSAEVESAEVKSVEIGKICTIYGRIYKVRHMTIVPTTSEDENE